MRVVVFKSLVFNFFAPELMIQIKLNGEMTAFEGQPSVADLLKNLHLGIPSFAVAVNRSVIPRSEHEKVLLQEGDEVEVVHAVGGG
jgi:sulfur carrier protein